MSDTMRGWRQWRTRNRTFFFNLKIEFDWEAVKCNNKIFDDLVFADASLPVSLLYAFLFLLTAVSSFSYYIEVTGNSRKNLIKRKNVGRYPHKQHFDFLLEFKGRIIACWLFTSRWYITNCISYFRRNTSGVYFINLLHGMLINWIEVARVCTLWKKRLIQYTNSKLCTSLAKDVG